ncbi:MAG: FG-GAP-like repeat-containing protein [Candidatus Latescibacterota bacterium]|jgi:hypothetical protein
MRWFAVVLLLLAAAPVQAITWSFDQEGDTEGWTVRDGTSNPVLAPLLRSEVRDGIWRIWPGPLLHDQAIIGLISPRIGRDSELYDRIRVRLRAVQSRPIVGALQLLWLNSSNAVMGLPGVSPPIDSSSEFLRLDFEKMVKQIYGTDWCTLELADLRSEVFYGHLEMGGPLVKERMVWEGELLDLVVNLFTYNVEQYPARAGDVPEAVEIDWIQLTGFGEQLQGEESPPEIEAVASFGEHFAAPVFAEVRVGMNSMPWVPMAFLGDVEGDGDLDLVSLWTDGDRQGWVVATNDGEGGFTAGVSAEGAAPFFLGAVDLDEDGRIDLVLNDGSPDLQIRHNAAEEGFLLVQRLPEMIYLGVGDAEGDGDADVWAWPAWEEKAVVWLNDGAGRLDRSQPLGPDLSAQGFAPWTLMQDGQGHGRGLLWRPPLDNLGRGYWISCLSSAGEEIQAHLGAAVDPFLVRYAGDVDGDGDVDLVVSNSRGAAGYAGLDVLVNGGDGQMERKVWQEEALLANDVQLVDLDGDGVLDAVFVEIGTRGSSVVVGRGEGRGVFSTEGRYPLEGAGGAVLVGDVDGDEDSDLVVLESAYPGGVHVLLNQSAERDNTAVTGESVATPAVFHLGPSYPNPFNPQTWIPVEIPAATEPVHLQIYNLLGQPIRTLVNGQLTPGYHAVPWDGRDERGLPASSGVYLYRLEAGAWRATGKMVKTQ